MTLATFQQQLKSENIQAFLVTRNNMYIKQDIKDEENMLLHLSGFSGSDGYMLVTPHKAWLFVDSRYYIQARLETATNTIEVVDVKSFFPEIIGLLKEQNIQNLTCNPWCISISDWNLLKKAQINMIANETLLANKVCPCDDIFEHVLEFAGKPAQEKCSEIAKLSLENFDAMLITSADIVSWLANLRAKDLEFTPVLRAYAVLSKNGELKIFSDNCRYKDIMPLSELYAELKKYADKKIAVDHKTTPQKMLDYICDTTLVVNMLNPIYLFKLNKNAVELNGFKNAHIRDGVSMVKFLYWLENNYQNKTETDIVDKLKSFRKQNDMYFSDSFATIAASAKNAAIVHYHPDTRNSVTLQENSVLLLDSGAQYFDGTTDVTRTIAIGNPSDEIKNAFTQVLKAHIKLSSLIFPNNIQAVALDAICRSELWRYYKNYGHGTGHSVGHFSNVHEYPFGLSPNNFRTVQENYVTSIEPGYYQENKYGIRIENMVYVEKTDNDDFLQFKNLTLVPIDKRLINVYLLDNEERNWLNNYHKEVINCLAPHLDSKENIWLKGVCSPL
ncbi:MAG: aminopeptidase P family protein [Alphaproteobacteria bacterium]|nr:aminopeptidase P family protein [Alphaproteobacteria bacterium]